jgi:hypothetical protein
MYMRLNLIHNNIYIKNLYHLHRNITTLRSSNTLDILKLIINKSNKENASKQNNKNNNILYNNIRSKLTT